MSGRVLDNRLTQVGGLVAFRHLDRSVASQCHSGSGARLVLGQFGGGVETGGSPEAFMELSSWVLRLIGAGAWFTVECDLVGRDVLLEQPFVTTSASSPR